MARIYARDTYKEQLKSAGHALSSQ